MTKTFKYLYLLCGCIGLFGAYQYLMHDRGIAIVFVGFVLCILFRMLFVRSLVKDYEEKEGRKS
ncbi:MAG: hypothetical protein ACOX81_04115 [Candidatus Heteroscillospira sp.]|jgi:uncharacterized membrane protein YfcA